MDSDYIKLLNLFSNVLNDASKLVLSCAEYEEEAKKVLGDDVNPLNVDDVFFNDKFIEFMKENTPLVGSVLVNVIELGNLIKECNDFSRITPEQKRVIADKLNEIAVSLDGLIKNTTI